MIVEELEMNEIEGDGHDVEQYNDGEAAGDPCAVFGAFQILEAGGGGGVLGTVAGHGMDAFEKT